VRILLLSPPTLSTVSFTSRMCDDRLLALSLATRSRFRRNSSRTIRGTSSSINFCLTISSMMPTTGTWLVSFARSSHTHVSINILNMMLTYPSRYSDTPESPLERPHRPFSQRILSPPGGENCQHGDLIVSRGIVPQLGAFTMPGMLRARFFWLRDEGCRFGLADRIARYSSHQ
jgi:hypothetical protein